MFVDKRKARRLAFGAIFCILVGIVAIVYALFEIWSIKSGQDTAPHLYLILAGVVAIVSGVLIRLAIDQLVGRL